MILINQKPSDILVKLEQGKSIFCKFGELYQLKTNVRNIKYANFTELYFRSYGNPYYSSDLKAHPQSFEDFLALEFREYYPEMFVYTQIDTTGTEAQFDVIKDSATELPIGVETKNVDLCSVSNIVGSLYAGSANEMFYTSVTSFDGIETSVNQKILFTGQTDKKQNGIWKVVKKRNVYTVGNNYAIDDLFINGLNVYVVTSAFTATDFITDAPNYLQLNTFQQDHVYAVNDKIYFEKPLGEIAVYNCQTAHTSLTFFDPTKFEAPIEINTYEWLQRDMLTNKVLKSQYISVLLGNTQAGFNYQINIPVTQDYIIFGGNLAEEINPVVSSVALIDVPTILGNQNILITLTDRVKQLYAAKWFPPKWLSD